MTRTIADQTPTSRSGWTLRIASVPAAHVYVRHLTPPDGNDDVVRLPDPRPADHRNVTSGRWPPVMLDPLWIRRNHCRFDIFHIHFGFDSVPPKVLADIVSELRDADKPLVYTVHDLRNPFQPDPRGHREQLDVLIPAADALLTLTPGAAARIEQQWGRTAHVLPHPHVVAPELIRAERPARRRFVIGVHVKSLRPDMDPLPLLNTIAATIRSLPDAVLKVNLHDELFQPGNRGYAPHTGATLLDYGRLPGVELHVHRHFTDSQLCQYLSSLDVSVLPYRFGTHSGWLEACYDLGTAVIAPSCGFYDQQHHCEVFGFDEGRFDPASLHQAIRAGYDHGMERATWPMRRSQREHLATAHRDIYEQVLAR